MKNKIIVKSQNILSFDITFSKLPDAGHPYFCLINHINGNANGQ